MGYAFMRFESIMDFLFVRSKTNPMKRIEHKLYMTFFIIIICISLTGCGNYTNISEEVEPSQTEENSLDMDRENIVEESDSDDAVEEEAETGETDDSNDDDALQLKPCATYQDILDNAYEVIIADNMTDIVLSDERFSYDGIREAKMGRNTEESLACIGYTYYDVDGNGIEELIIADTGPEGWNNRILLMYTLYDNKPVLLIDGWARNRYYLLNDGTIYNEGSSGAAYTAFGTYRIAEDGCSLEVIDYYYTGSYGNSGYGWFYNTTGEQAEDESEIIEFEKESVPGNMMEDYMAQVKELELTFFGELNENHSEQTAQAAYFAFLSGDVSLLEDMELGQSWVDFYLPNSELEYAFLDLDGDEVSELLIQWIDSPEGCNAVFHYRDGKLLCWNFDTVEMSSRDYPLQNGTMVHQYDYGGTSSWTVFRYLPDGETEPLFNLFARYEVIYDNDTSPVPYYEIDGVEVDQVTFDSELKERITNQLLERSIWTALSENSAAESGSRYPQIATVCTGSFPIEEK